MSDADHSAGGDLENRIKRLRIRCWRRGTKEMDLILGGFVDRHGASLNASDVEQLEALVLENDHDLYRWVAGAEPAPDQHRALIARLADRNSAETGIAE